MRTENGILTQAEAVFGVKKSLLADFRKVDDPASAKQLGFANPFWKVEHDFALARAGDHGN